MHGKWGRSLLAILLAGAALLLSLIHIYPDRPHAEIRVGQGHADKAEQAGHQRIEPRFAGGLRLVAVSYTHLDVYKRQSIHSTHTEAKHVLRCAGNPIEETSC